MKGTRAELLGVIGLLAIAVPTDGLIAQESYDYRERTRQLAFDPARFFEQRYPREPYIAITYTGDDYDYPVYSIAVRKGCTEDDVGEARKSCGNRLTARMVRAPADEEPERPRWRGMALFSFLGKRDVTDDKSLKAALDEYEIDWLEAEVNECAPAVEHLGTASAQSYFTRAPLPEEGQYAPFVLHADKIRFSVGTYIERSTYYGWIGEGTPGRWAHDFAMSLDGCWKPAEAIAPWHKEI